MLSVPQTEDEGEGFESNTLTVAALIYLTYNVLMLVE